MMHSAELIQDPRIIRHNRSDNSEDIAKRDICYYEIHETDFQELTANELLLIDRFLKEVITNIPFNSFYSAIQIARETEILEDPLLAIQSVDIDSEDRPTYSGLNCVGMSYELKRRLQNIGISSHLIPAHGGKLINQEAEAYADNSHILLAIPAIIEDKRVFILLDPGMIITDPIILELDSEDPTAIAKANQSDHFTHSFSIGQRPNGKADHVRFNPFLEILNPDDTATIDVMRGSTNLAYVRHNEAGERLALIDMNLLRRRFRFILRPGVDERFPDGFRQSVTFEQLINRQINEETLCMIIQIIGPYGLVIEDIYKMAEFEYTYKNHIYAPSVRDNL